MKVSIEKIKFIKELYPRFELDNYTVNQYRQSIDKLPPIIISKNHVLIDGYHRLIAHKLEGLTEIEVEFFDSEDEQEILIESIKRNSTHGRQLSIEEKRNNARRLFNVGIEDLERIGSILSVSSRSVGSWTKKLRDSSNEKRDSEILELYLQCYERDEIGELVGLTGRQVWNILGKNRKFSEISKPDNLQFYNVWNVGRLGPDQLKYPGQTPLEIVENIVYYYTPPPVLKPLKLAKVVDPMAGSGVVREACRKILCRYMLFDIEPLREDIPIKKNNILEGFPEEANGTDLVYFDPPYYNLMDEYPKNPFNESYDSFLEAMKISFESIDTILNNRGKIALILKPMNEEMLGGDWLDMTVDCVSIAREINYKIIKRICAPLSTQQFEAHNVSQAKERGVMLNVLRDIIILERS